MVITRKGEKIKLTSMELILAHEEMKYEYEKEFVENELESRGFKVSEDMIHRITSAIIKELNYDDISQQERDILQQFIDGDREE